MTVVFIFDSSLAPGCASCWAARSGSLGRPRVAPVSDSAGAEHRVATDNSSHDGDGP